MRADFKYEGKEPSESYKLTIDSIGVTRMSIQSNIRETPYFSVVTTWTCYLVLVVLL